MIEISELSKVYGKERLVAVDSINLSVKPGELFGLIGPDGAGKSSIFRILATLLLPDGGSAIVNGYDVVKDFQSIRNCIGYMPGRFSLYQDLTIEENLNFFATVFNTTVKENYHLIKDIYVQIEPFKNRRAGKLSGGMKQKLALCCALIHKPEVLLLDEPTTGVDVVSRKEFWDMLKSLQQNGLTIMVSTPYMDEAALCDNIALIQKGKILSVSEPASLIASYGEPLYTVSGGNMYRMLDTLRSFPHTSSCFAFGDALHLTLKNGIPASLALDHMRNQGFNEVQINNTTPGIEDCFIKLLKTD